MLTEVDSLSNDAQHALRRTMEKYVATCRLILITNSTSRVLPAIRSRCLNIRVPAPSEDEIISILQVRNLQQYKNLKTIYDNLIVISLFFFQSVCKKEKLNLPPALAAKIVQKSERNLRCALLMCEACKVEQYPFDVNQRVPDPFWKSYLQETARMILSEQSPKKLMEVRGRLYDVLCKNIPVEIIFKVSILGLLLLSQSLGGEEMLKS